MHNQQNKNLATAALLFAGAMAQSPTVTSFFPICPTPTSTTITLATTITFCPGPYCNGPTVTPPPVNGVGQPGIHVGEFTSVGPDGMTTVLGIWETVYNSMCESGLVPATYTITAPCPCENTPEATVLPTGFETTVVPCSACEANGGPATITLTQPCPTGPYATQTPSTGQPQNPIVAAASAAAAANAMAGGSGVYASAGASAGASANAVAGGSGAMASANAGANAMAGAGSAGAAASAKAAATAVGAMSAAPGMSTAMAGQGIVSVIPVNGTTLRNGTAPMMPTQPPVPISSYMSSGSKSSSFAGFTLLAGIFAVFLL